MKVSLVALARACAVVAALLAVAAAAKSALHIDDSTASATLNSWWRVVGLFTFAALFTLLATKDTFNFRLWGVLLISKLVLVILALGPLRAVDGSTSWLLWDSIVVLLLGTGWLFAKLHKNKTDGTAS